MNTIIPVRCYTCGKVLGNLGDRYDNLLKEGKTTEEAMDHLGLIRYCCRMNLFNPTVLPPNAFDHSKAFVDLTFPKSGSFTPHTPPVSKLSVGGITLSYHTIVPGELALPAAGKPKLEKVEEVYLEDLGPPRPPIRAMDVTISEGRPKKILIAR